MRRKRNLAPLLKNVEEKSAAIVIEARNAVCNGESISIVDASWRSKWWSRRLILRRTFPVIRMVFSSRPLTQDLVRDLEGDFLLNDQGP